MMGSKVMSNGQGKAEETKLKFIYQCTVIRNVQVQERKHKSRAPPHTQVKPMRTEDRHKASVCFSAKGNLIQGFYSIQEVLRSDMST